METFFAPPEKSSDEELSAEIRDISDSSVVSGLLRTIGGLLAVLNEHRQIIAINDSFIKMLGIDDPAQSLGLRMGEALECIHAAEMPAGCGTSAFCSTCGAAVAIVTSLSQNIPVERLCALSANRGGKPVDIVLLVRSHPITIEDKRFLLLFVQDITQQEQRAALERTFYHDINNMLSMLVQASELLIEEEASNLAKIVHQTAIRLAREVSIQRCLRESTLGSYQPMWDNYTIKQVFDELKSFFANHPVAMDKRIEFSDTFKTISFKTDISLFLRVVSNMIINALEATDVNSAIKVWYEQEGDFFSFCVWNAQEVPADIAKRIFQRNFSTKAQAGRGIGTFSMKLFGEAILGGKVRFTSSRDDGTVFRFIHRLN